MARRHVLWFSAIALILLPMAAARAATYEAPLAVRRMTDATFTRTPVAARSSDGVKIAFEVSAATDAEVAILDAQGKVVRHLAAGLLGNNAPEPFRKNALAQEIVWNGKDDAGMTSASGPFKVRVRLGSQAKLDKYLGQKPLSFSGEIYAITVGLGGELFVLFGESQKFGRAEMAVLGKDGTYRRTIMPYPASTPEERAKSVGQICVDGQRVPILYSSHAFSVYPLTCGLRSQSMAWHPKGYLVAASSPGTAREHGVPRYLIAIDPQGGAPQGVNFVGPKIREPNDFLGGGGERAAEGLDRLAVSPDGEYVYFVQCLRSKRFMQSAWKHGVFRVKWSDASSGQLWLGKDAPGSADGEFNDPQGIAVDKDGNLFVCDRGNNRIQIFSAEGKLLGKIVVECPEQIAVDRASGALFVLSCPAPRISMYGAAEYGGVLRAFKPWQGGKSEETGRFILPGIRCMAVDPVSVPSRIWLVTHVKGSPQTIIAVEFANGTFTAGEPVRIEKGPQNPSFLAADPKRGRLFYREHLSGSNSTFQLLELEPDVSADSGIKGADLTLDRMGNLYVMDGYGKHSLSRYDPDGKPLPFSGMGTHKIAIKYRSFGPNMGLRGHRVAPNGDIFVIHSQGHGVGAPLDVYGSDGRLKKANLVGGLGAADSGLGVDAMGNIFVGMNVRSKEKPFPDEFKNQLPAEHWLWWKTGGAQNKQPAPWSYLYYNHFLWNMGAVFKFGAAGGRVYGHQSASKTEPASPGCELEKAPGDAVAFKSAAYKFDVKVAGAQWRYGGLGGVPASRDEPRPDPGCSCMPTHLDTDLYGRTYVPNTFLFAVDMIDAAGNRIARIGRYDNRDYVGPEIVFSAPEACDFAEDDGKLYVSDISARRFAVIGFTWAAVAEAAIP